MAGALSKARIWRLEKSACSHEKKFEFDEAAHRYFRLAMLGESSTRFTYLMRAASCKERAQNWRQHTGLWERLAYELAKSVGQDFTHRMDSFRARTRTPGQLGIFHTISYDEWANPTSGLINLAPGKDRDASRHFLQRAWAYQWAAEEAEASGRLGHAARLWRLAGLSFIDERCPKQDRLREAARSFLHGATCTLRWEDWVQMRFVATVRWNGQSVDWGDPRTKADADDGAAPPAPGEAAQGCLTDLEWHELAWSRLLDGIHKREARIDALEEYARELKQIQQLLLSVGDRRNGVKVYRRRMRRDIELARLRHEWPKYLWKSLYYGTSLSGSSALLSLAVALAANAVIVPLLYWSTGAAQAGTMGTQRATFPDTVILSLANVVSLSTSRAHLVTQWASALQAAQAVSGYIILAFILWVALRFSEQ